MNSCKNEEKYQGHSNLSPNLFIRRYLQLITTTQLGNQLSLTNKYKQKVDLAQLELK